MLGRRIYRHLDAVLLVLFVFGHFFGRRAKDASPDQGVTAAAGRKELLEVLFAAQVIQGGLIFLRLLCSDTLYLVDNGRGDPRVSPRMKLSLCCNAP